MKNAIIKIFVFLIVLAELLMISAIIWYFSNVNVYESVVVQSKTVSEFTVTATSPTGGNIFFRNDGNGRFSLKNRYLKEILISTEVPSEFNARIDIGLNSFEVSESDLIKKSEKTFVINPNLFPKSGLFAKISVIFKNNSLNLLKYYVVKSKGLLGIFFLVGIFILVWVKLYKKFRDKPQVLIRSLVSRFNSIIEFIRQENVKILIVFCLSCLVPLFYFFCDKEIINYLNISLIQFIITFGALIFPLLFFSIYSKKLHINPFFWWSFFISFLILVFVIKPDCYLYGIGFRDDISKFFVKANNNNLIDCLFKPDAGYLNLYQNASAYFILKILNFKQYFPEALQIYTAFCFSALFASFNFKSIRFFITDDCYRFFISILFALSPFAFLSAFFLYEVPFVAAAILFLYIFANFKKGSTNKSTLIASSVVFIIFALSKPIFLILLPFVLAVIVKEGFIHKNKITLKLFSLIFVSILVQLIVVFLSSKDLNSSGFQELGTQYEQSFSLESRSLFLLLPSAIFIFIHKFSEFSGLIYSGSSLVNLIINFLTIAFILLLVVYYILNLVKKKKRFISWFCISALAFSFVTVLLYVKVVNPNDLVSGDSNFVNLSFGEMLKSRVVIPGHRYLMPAAFVNFMVFLVFLFDISEKLIHSDWLRHLVRIFLIVFIAAVPLIRFIKQYHEVIKIKESVSYWRTFNNLIFESGDEYYIPYNGFPNQKQCIKCGIDKIIDVYDVENNYINISDLHENANQWQIIEIILENNSNEKFAKLAGCTSDGDTISAILVNDHYQPVNSLVYRFDKFYKLESLNITYSDKLTQYNGLVRIIGKY